MGAVLGAPRVGVATTALDTALELPPLVTGREASAALGTASEGSCSESSGTYAEDVRGDAPRPAAGAEGMPAGLPRCRVIRG